MTLIAAIILVFFGLFMVWAGFMMFLKPEVVKQIIAKAGSTFLINYTELGLRFIVGCAMIFVTTDFAQIYQPIGYFLIVSALILMLVPIKKHHAFSVKAAEMLKPIHLKFAAPIAIISGVLTIYGIF